MSDERRYKIFTIGVYGFTEERFFNALKTAGIELLCDIRRRRGVRGSKYRFANSKYLQGRLADLGIAYYYAIELAPSNEIRAKQWRADKYAGVSKRGRELLDETFAEAYRQRHLQDFDARSFLDKISVGSTAICFLCVEKDPQACHRSLLSGSGVG